jgi:hypothetical protein
MIFIGFGPVGSFVVRRSPRDDRQLAGVVLDERGQALDPVAVVAVENAVDVADFGLVDVPAHDAVAAAAARFVGHHALELRDEVHRVLDLMLQVLRQRPVVEAELRAHAIEPAVEQQDHRVGGVAEIGEPFGVLDHAIEEIAVHDP